MKPVVSIIVPVYNVEDYLSKCLDSLINQSLREIEIIIVDDGSTDNSLLICRKYEELDQRIKVITKKNGGLSDARNVGLAYSEAEYVGFIDSDDYVDLDFFATLYEGVIKNNAKIGVAQIKKTDEKGNTLFICGTKGKELLNSEEAMESMLTGKGISNSVCNKLFRRDLFGDNPFPVGKLYEDEYVTYRVVHKCDNVFYTDKVSYYYRTNQQGITHYSFSEKELHRIEASLIRIDFLRDNYPRLVKHGERYLMYDCLTTLSKMSKYRKEYDYIILGNIKKTLASYLRGNSSLGAKAFAVLAAISPTSAVYLYSKLGKIRRRER